jgi:hypothetical protein
MPRRVPYEVEYSLVKKFDNVSKYVLSFSALLSVIVIVNEHANFVINKERINDSLNAILGILGITYFLLDMFTNLLFQNAESNRKNDFIDNSFKTNLSDSNSEEYFSNDNIDSGIYKLGVNCFENCFFSKEITKMMLMPMIIKSMLIILLYLFVVIFTNQKTAISVLQISLPFAIISQTIRVIVLSRNLKQVAQNFKNIFSTLGVKKQNPLIIDNVINYEKALSAAYIQFDSKLFKKHNNRLSIEWERLKQNLHI